MTIRNLSITQLNEMIIKPISHFSMKPSSQALILMSGFLYSTEQFNDNVYVQLTSQEISIKKSSEQCEKIELNFSIKFQVILQNEKNIKSRKIGFKIIKENCSQPYRFYNNDQAIINKWIVALSNKINQNGFHNFFKPIRRLGRGQFATVFEVQKLDTGFKYAVKAFSKSHLTKTDKGMESLINQIKIMRTFSHKNLQKLQSVYQSDNSIYLVTQLLRGGSLFDRVNKINQQNKKFKLQNLKQFMFGLLSGLKELSGLNIVHRDLKLDNIMLRSPNCFEPVIIDFGLATFSDQPQYLYHRCGTPGYVSPEVMACVKNKKTESISDIFSAGAIFHQLLTEKPLFEGNTPEQVLTNNKSFLINLSCSRYGEINKQAMYLLQKMLQINPSKRINASESIQHDFFTDNYKINSPVPTEPNINNENQYLLSQ